jgi:hypothetical protein
MISFRVSAISNKELRSLARIASEAGWHIELTNGNHVRWKPPAPAPFYITPLTPRSNKCVFEMRSKLRQHGVLDAHR